MIPLISVLILVAAAACSDLPANAVGGDNIVKEPDMTPVREAAARPVRQLPDSFGRTFATLDQYLDHLRRYAATVDKPWYREVRPGVYERVTTMVPRREPEIYTRAQLMERFGFTR
ncbi:MAG TPA: hypothetical protein VEX35_08860 [Allosphingosinicella sp.]|nr:hypothetical protein [Allosphingosinicella sp.]